MEAVGRITCKFTTTLNARNILPDKHKESGGLVRLAFSLKSIRNGRGRSCVTYKLTVKMKPRRNLYGIHSDFSGVGSKVKRGCK